MFVISKQQELCQHEKREFQGIFYSVNVGVKKILRKGKEMFTGKEGERSEGEGRQPIAAAVEQ